MTKRFRVSLKPPFGTQRPFPVWSFWISWALRRAGVTFPDSAWGFDCSHWSDGRVFYVADSLQALVAYDWLLEEGWELDREEECETESVTDRASFYRLLDHSPGGPE